MADVLPFPPRVPEAAHTLGQLVARKRSPMPTCDVTMAKDTRTRRYVLRPEAPGVFRGEVWFDRCQHRTKRVSGVHDARMLSMQFARELRDLLADGWTEA